MCPPVIKAMSEISNCCHFLSNPCIIVTVLLRRDVFIKIDDATPLPPHTPVIFVHCQFNKKFAITFNDIRKRHEETVRLYGN